MLKNKWIHPKKDKFNRNIRNFLKYYYKLYEMIQFFELRNMQFLFEMWTKIKIYQFFFKNSKKTLEDDTTCYRCYITHWIDSGEDYCIDTGNSLNLWKKNVVTAIKFPWLQRTHVLNLSVWAELSRITGWELLHVVTFWTHEILMELVD